jgi:hypothetical protein
MSLDLNNFFRLGLTSEDDPIEQQMMQTIRTAPETTSTNLNRVVFRLPTQGILTRDSLVSVQVQQPVGGTESNVSVNCLNGVLNSIKQFRMTIDGQELVRLENPGYLATNDMYSKNTNQTLTDREQYMYGNGFRVKNTEDSNLEEFDDSYNLRQTVGGMKAHKYLVTAGNANRVYGIPLHALGATFLKEKNLPLFLMKGREVHLHIDFHSDAREYAVKNGGIAAGDAQINLPRCELVTTHILLSEDVEQAEIDNLKNETYNFPMLEDYLIRGTLTTGVVDVEKTNLYRLNLQGRELHRVLMAFRDPNNARNDFVANAKSVSLGDEELMVKQNGLNLFERPINNAASLYYLHSLYNMGRSLKVSNLCFNTNKNTEARAQSTNAAHLATRGRVHYVGVDVSNGAVQLNSMGVPVQVPYGGGVRQTTAFEVQYKQTPRVSVNPDQVSRNLEPLFYVCCAKLLRISPNKVMITF